MIQNLVGIANTRLFAPPPVEALPLYHGALLALAVGLALAAVQAWRLLGLAPCRKLGLLAALQAGGAAACLLERATGVGGWSYLVAGHSLLDLGVIALSLYGARRLARSGHLGARSVIVTAVAAAATLFWGLASYQAGRPLLFGSSLAALCHLSYLALLSALIIRMLLGELRTDLVILRSQLETLERTNAGLQGDLGRSREILAEKNEHFAEQKQENQLLRQRARTLEQILAVSARMGATRSMPDLLDQVVHAAREILGFRMVLLRLYSESTQAFEARAFAGVPEEGIALLTNLQVTLEDYRKMAQPRFRTSESYFISHLDEEAEEATRGAYVPDLGPRIEGEWHEDDALIVPLISPSGETRGYMSLDDPLDRRVPPVGVIRQLEFLARQAVTAIESAEVYDRLATQNRELAQASELVKSLGEMKSNFVANVSHELRTPLTSITAYTEILEENAGSMPEEVRREFLRVINNEAGKLTGIVDDILNLSRMEEGSARASRCETDLVAIARRLEEQSLRRAMEREIAFVLETSADRILLDVDHVLIQQLMDHLLGNAFKFTPEGGRIRLAIEDRGQTVKIVVEDSGIGIPEEKMSYIFDRFYQADGSSTREHGGQGIGLSLCQEIVRGHDGRIWAENSEPQGARFHVVLPRRQPVVQRLDRRPSALGADQGREFLERLIHWIAETAQVGIVSLMVPDATGDHLVIQAATGLPEAVVQSTRVTRGAGVVGKVWASGRSLLLPDVTSDDRFGKSVNDPRYSTPSLLCVPLLEGLDVIGVVNVNNRHDGRPLDLDDRFLLEALAPRIAHLLRHYQGQQQRSCEFAEVQEALRSVTAVQQQLQDRLTDACHEICLAAAKSLKLPEEELEHLALALQCYDVGLSQVPDQLLHKQTPLSAEEERRIQRHVQASLEILRPLALPSKVRQVILHHHERYDGLGYPEGLDGEAIPIGARLLALSDSLNAMLQGRSYQEPLVFDEALAALEQRSGSQYCPRMIAPFLVEARARRARIEDLQRERAARPRPPDPVLLPAGASLQNWQDGGSSEPLASR